MKTIDYLIKKFDGVLVDNYDNYIYAIKDKPYTIRFDPSRVEWSCDCKAFIYRYKFKRKYCKHILEVQDRKFKQRHQSSGRAGARVV